LPTWLALAIFKDRWQEKIENCKSSCFKIYIQLCLAINIFSKTAKTNLQLVFLQKFDSSGGIPEIPLIFVFNSETAGRKTEQLFEN